MAAQVQFIPITRPSTMQIGQVVTAVLGGLLPPVEVGDPGHALRIVWAPVYGATKARVDSARLLVGAAAVQQVLGDLNFVRVGSGYEISIPEDRRIASLTLHGLKTAAGEELRTEADIRALPAPQRHLVLRSLADGQPGAPLFAVPPVDARGLLPAALTGAGLADRVLSLPDLKASKIRLSLVQNRFPEDFAEQEFSLQRVTAVATLYPLDLELLDPAGTTIWQFPGEYPLQNPPAEIDLRTTLEPALNAALSRKQPLEATLHLRGAAPTSAGLRFDGAQGALLREFPGVLGTLLAGDPQSLALDDRLADEAPATVRADLTVTYGGIRLLEEFSDSAPGPGAAQGLVVGEQPRFRVLPPKALAQHKVARIAVIGRAPVDCELSLQLVEMPADDRPAAALGPPAVIRPPLSPAIESHWLELPAVAADAARNAVAPLGIAVRASRGRFLWATGATDQPLVRIAVFDSDPGSRPLRLNGTEILRVAQADEIHLPGQSFPAGLFRSRAPVLDSPLFLSVDLSDLTLEYAR